MKLYIILILCTFLCVNILSEANSKEEKEKEEVFTKPSEDKLAEYHDREINAIIALRKAEKQFGKDSEDYYNELSVLAVMLYKQWKWRESFEYGKQLIGLTEKLYGVESEKTARVLMNVAGAAQMLKERDLVETLTKRALYIFIKVHGADSKTVLGFRGKMLSYNVRDADTATGTEYDDYRFDLEYHGFDDEL